MIIDWLLIDHLARSDPARASGAHDGTARVPFHPRRPRGGSRGNTADARGHHVQGARPTEKCGRRLERARAGKLHAVAMGENSQLVEFKNWGNISNLLALNASKPRRIQKLKHILQLFWPKTPAEFQKLG